MAYCLFFIINFLLCTITLVFSECERGWLHYGNSCYYISDTKKSWASAASFCRAYHSQLADVQTREENTFLVDTIDKIERDTGTVHEYWLDGTDQVLEGVWVWASTGKQLSYTNWYPNEPNSAGGNEDCLEIKDVNVNGWNDNNCSLEFNFICEMEFPASGNIIGK
ncbi:Hypothetical predicted protein [Mytilus galloprovincialis]|uniref:C-type lectin domain-containing protein n=1 Tax=Mytilus galloprovincialis TaxID=29158 RepID=A0A8B6GV63_MYTGA|nr:Hypothetical predicted protein [Mytilus galloprovincialis]